MKKGLFLFSLAMVFCSQINAQTTQPASARKGAELSPGQTAVVITDTTGTISTTTRGVALPSASPDSVSDQRGTPSQPADEKKKPKR